jgi:hypothetical protein
LSNRQIFLSVLRGIVGILGIPVVGKGKEIHTEHGIDSFVSFAFVYFIAGYITMIVSMIRHGDSFQTRIDIGQRVVQIDHGGITAMLGTFGYLGVVAAISFGREEYPSVGRVVDEFSSPIGIILDCLFCGCRLALSFG